MYPCIELIYEDIDLCEYKVVFYHRNYKSWKGLLTHIDSRIYAHEDVVKELDLEVLGKETFERKDFYF